MFCSVSFLAQLRKVRHLKFIEKVPFVCFFFVSRKRSEKTLFKDSFWENSQSKTWTCQETNNRFTSTCYSVLALKIVGTLYLALIPKLWRNVLYLNRHNFRVVIPKMTLQPSWVKCTLARKRKSTIFTMLFGWRRALSTLRVHYLLNGF